MTETRQNKEGTRVATFSKNSSITHPPSHRYTVTLTKKGRTVENTINRHVPNITAARTLSRDWTEGRL